MAGDSWLSEHDACARLGLEIMEKINERDKNSRTSSNYTKLSALIRTSLRKFSSDLGKLRQNLMRASTAYHITQRELERRQGMLDSLTTKEKQMEEAFNNTGANFESVNMQSLLGTGAVDTFSSADPWGMRDEPQEFQGLGNADLQQQQRHIIEEQDRGLDGLSHVIARQRQMAIDIGNEVDVQNEIIDDITDHVDTTKDRLIKETRHIRIIDRKSNTCCYWVVIVLLFIAIVVILVVPYHGKP